jgi:hypothetical protein
MKKKFNRKKSAPYWIKTNCPNIWGDFIKAIKSYSDYDKNKSTYEQKLGLVFKGIQKMFSSIEPEYVIFNITFDDKIKQDLKDYSNYIKLQKNDKNKKIPKWKFKSQ